MEYQQVFLSHCVRSAGSAAKQLDQMVQSVGLSTFICVDMEAGDGFREAIVGNAANCKVMVLFMDEQWAQRWTIIMETCFKVLKVFCKKQFLKWH